MIFDPISIDLGRVKSNVKHTLAYKIGDEVVTIDKVVTSCGCSSPIIDMPNRKVIVDFIPDEVPIHLTKLKIFEYATTKTLTVTFYKVGEQTPRIIVLTFKAIISNN